MGVFIQKSKIHICPQLVLFCTLKVRFRSKFDASNGNIGLKIICGVFYLSVYREKRFDWVKENNMFEKLSLISKNDLFELNNIFLIQTKYFWAK